MTIGGYECTPDGTQSPTLGFEVIKGLLKIKKKGIFSPELVLAVVEEDACPKNVIRKTRKKKFAKKISSCLSAYKLIFLANAYDYWRL